MVADPYQLVCRIVSWIEGVGLRVREEYILHSREMEKGFIIFIILIENWKRLGFL